MKSKERFAVRGFQTETRFKFSVATACAKLFERHVYLKRLLFLFKMFKMKWVWNGVMKNNRYDEIGYYLHSLKVACLQHLFIIVSNFVVSFQFKSTLYRLSFLFKMFKRNGVWG